MPHTGTIDYHGENMKLLLALCFTTTLPAQTWTPQTGNTRASLRGVSAVDAGAVWASGSGGTYLATTDGGVSWRAAQVPGAETLDFRGIRAIDARTVYLMSAGSGGLSRIYKTTDAGAHWTLLFTNPDPKGFFDAFAFWDARHGIVVGDQVEGRAGIFTTGDGGQTWKLFDSGAYNAMSFVPGGDGWAVGPRGRIARFQPPAH